MGEKGSFDRDQTQLNTSVQHKQKATVYPEIIKQLSVQLPKPHAVKSKHVWVWELPGPKYSSSEALFE